MISVNDQDFIFIDNYWYLYDVDNGEILCDIGYKLVNLTTLH